MVEKCDGKADNLKYEYYEKNVNKYNTRTIKTALKGIKSKYNLYNK